MAKKTDWFVCHQTATAKQGFQVLLHDGKHNNLFTRYSEHHATEYQATSHHIDFEHALCSWLLCWSMKALLQVFEKTTSKSKEQCKQRHHLTLFASEPLRILLVCKSWTSREKWWRGQGGAASTNPFRIELSIKSSSVTLIQGRSQPPPPQSKRHPLPSMPVLQGRERRLGSSQDHDGILRDARGLNYRFFTDIVVLSCDGSARTFKITLPISRAFSFSQSELEPTSTIIALKTNDATRIQEECL